MNEARALFEDVRKTFEATRAEWLAQARALAERLGRNGAVVTVDEIRNALPIPEGVDPRVCGAIFLPRDWECLGYANSRRAICHGRPIGAFKRRLRSDTR